ncbi:MAG: hypothetical protein WC262_09490 [Bacteroidales bacterium]
MIPLHDEDHATKPIQTDIYIPTHLKRWTHPDSYIGTEFSEHFILLGRNRDSNLIDQSNFCAALRMLGGESETVIVHRASHWACGWVEVILIHEYDDARLRIGDAIHKSLAGWPILDEEDHAAREAEAIAEELDTIRKHPDWYPDAPTDEEELYEYALCLICEN